MSKIQVPKGMLTEAVSALMLQWESNHDGYSGSAMGMAAREEYEAVLNIGLPAALMWLSENPIVPSDEQIKKCENGWLDAGGNRNGAFIPYVLIEWQRWMFAALEVPEELRKLKATFADVHQTANFAAIWDRVDKSIDAAYRLGQQSKESK